MVRIAWGTDWHLDHASPETRRKFFAAVATKQADALVMAGDIGTALCVEERLEDLAESFPGPVYVVLGNHDFYGSSVAAVRERIRALAAHTPNLVYLWDEGKPVALSEKTAMVGVDGWGDARYGNWSGTQVALNDFRLIHDLAWNVARPLAVEKLRALGDESALRLRPRLEAALRGYETVLVVTHVPPFREAAWHEGAASDDDWAPYFACKAVGDVLLEAAGVHPERKIVVLCGHTHSGGECTPLPNLRVITGPSVYGLRPSSRTSSFLDSASLRSGSLGITRRDRLARSGRGPWLRLPSPESSAMICSSVSRHFRMTRPWFMPEESQYSWIRVPSSKRYSAYNRSPTP